MLYSVLMAPPDNDGRHVPKEASQMTESAPGEKWGPVGKTLCENFTICPCSAHG